MRFGIFGVVAIGVFIMAFYSCTTYKFRTNYKDVNKLLHETDSIGNRPFLKAHMHNGDVYILTDQWSLDQQSQAVSGTGTLYDFNRNAKFQGSVSIPVDSVAIFETNTKIVKPESSRVTALSILAGLDLMVGVFCLTNPKACFGSCPTFYLNPRDNLIYADAEGFSSAISPSLEYYDIDALKKSAINDGRLSLTMKNEALETHCIKDVKILAYPLKDGERVYHTPEKGFFLCRNHYSLTGAHASEGDVTRLLESQDRKERFSPADNRDLDCREEIYLDFDSVNDSQALGLILNFRQTLMTTYFIYSAMGYMGDEVGDIFSKLERNREMNMKLKDGISKKLGDVDVYVFDSDKRRWIFQGGLYETGPIAINRQFIPLQSWVKGPGVRIKLVLNKGLWRVDYAALSGIEKKVELQEFHPDSVIRNGENDSLALASLLSPDKHLISMPGSEYRFNFTFPGKQTDYELFLYSKGYYLEWMRHNWIKDKNLPKLRQMVYHPSKYLKSETQSYKKYEKTMETEFWNSRIESKVMFDNEK